RIPLGAISTAWRVREGSTLATRGSFASAAAAVGEPEKAKPSRTFEYTATRRPPSRPANCGAALDALTSPFRVTIQVCNACGGEPGGPTTAAAVEIVPTPTLTTIATRSAARVHGRRQFCIGLPSA